MPMHCEKDIMLTWRSERTGLRWCKNRHGRYPCSTKERHSQQLVPRRDTSSSLWANLSFQRHLGQLPVHHGRGH
jgi:hypothetical protein